MAKLDTLLGSSHKGKSLKKVSFSDPKNNRQVLLHCVLGVFVCVVVDFDCLHMILFSTCQSPFPLLPQKKEANKKFTDYKTMTQLASLNTVLLDEVY